MDMRHWSRSSLLVAGLIAACSVPVHSQVVVHRTGASPVADWLSHAPSTFGVRGWAVGQWARYSMSENVGAPMPMVQFRTVSVVGRRGTDFWVETQEEFSGMMSGRGPVRKMAVPFGPQRARVGTEVFVMSPDSAVRREVLLRAASAAGARPTSFPEGWTRVGEESLTTPAGTFTTIHYRRGSEELWASGEAGPVGLVRFRSSSLEIELVARGESGARSAIPFGGSDR
jgi:hypothetical protein